jgi:hypothetical protein
LYLHQVDELSPDLAELKKAFADPITGVRTKILNTHTNTYRHCFSGS